MNHRFLASTGVVGIFVAVVLLAGVFVAAQTPTAAVKPGTPAKTWSVSRTPDGQPDLQGFWTNTTYTPLERPKNVTKAFYTKEEARPEPESLRFEPAHFVDRGSAGWKTSSALSGRTEESRRARRDEKAYGWPLRRGTEPAALRALHPHGPQRTAHAWRRVQQ
ncbi:MAG: hypothetical protein DMG12_05185 [Acidobacteria bacterium]|nr:MAG: hypothetical protein DMG12_05185 [Acidobacteriota bacterium]